MEVVVLYAIPLLIYGCIIALVVWFLWSVGQGFLRTDLQHKLRRERTQDNYGMFAEYFKPGRAPEQVVKCVYDKLANEIFLKKRFPVRPADSLESVFAIGPEGTNDLDLLIHELAGRCGFAATPRDRKTNPPSTVEGLVLYLATQYSDNTPERDKATLLRVARPESNDTLLHPAQNTRSDQEELVRPPDPLC